MVPACRHLEPTVQVYTAMVLVMVCLTAAGAIRGFAEALVSVLAEDSVEAGGAGEAEADLAIGGKLTLYLFMKGTHYAKGKWNGTCRRRRRPGQR